MFAAQPEYPSMISPMEGGLLAFLIVLSALNFISAVGVFLAVIDGPYSEQVAQVVALFCFAINVTYLNWKIYVRLNGPTVSARFRGRPDRLASRRPEPKQRR